MPRDGVVFVSAHPDDEVIGAAARLARLAGATVIHVTDGAPRNMNDARANGFSTREEYARVRRREACAALAPVGIVPERIIPLGAVDQEASFALAWWARRLAHRLSVLGARIVYTHPYEGGHPDHDATAFIVHAARALLASGRWRGHGSRRTLLRGPEIHEFASYHAGPDGSGLQLGAFLDPNHAVSHSPATPARPIEVALSERDQVFKRRLLALFRTQAQIVGMFPIAVERFRRAPRYHFTSPPHAGVLHYERFDWGISGEEWRSLAATALAELALPPAEAL